MAPHAFAAEGYDIHAGEAWEEPSHDTAQRQTFTKFSPSSLDTGATEGLYTAAPKPNGVGLPVAVTDARAAGTPSSTLPALAPITLRPPTAYSGPAAPAYTPPASTYYDTGSAQTLKPFNATGQSALVPPSPQLIMPGKPVTAPASGYRASVSPAPAPFAAPAAPSASALPPIQLTPPSSAMPNYNALTTAPAPSSLPDRPEFAPPATLAGNPAPATVPAASAAVAVPLPPPPPLAGTLSPAMAAVPAASQTVAPAPAIAGSSMPSLNASVPAVPLAPETQRIAENLRPPAKVAEAGKPSHIGMKRVSPDVAGIVKKAEEVYESAGVSIRVSSPKLDVTSELEQAYEALTGGEPEVAIRIYQDILKGNPTNEDALFGLAATYHRTGQIDNARPLYDRLLKQNPHHREGLNNFLVLMANESPQAALQQLSQLEARNPDYSPIPAQMGILYDRLGEQDLARSKLLRAIEISPENWVYKYNLAIVLDRQGAYAEAASVYRDLIAASLQGEKLPVDLKPLQDRLTYISSRLRSS